MTFRSYRDIANANYGTSDDSISLDQIKTGALLKIADSVSAMAQNWTSLVRERDTFERLYRSERQSSERLLRRNSALRGAITKMKKAKP